MIIPFSPCKTITTVASSRVSDSASKADGARTGSSREDTSCVDGSCGVDLGADGSRKGVAKRFHKWILKKSRLDCFIKTGHSPKSACKKTSEAIKEPHVTHIPASTTEGIGAEVAAKVDQAASVPDPSNPVDRISARLSQSFQLLSRFMSTMHFEQSGRFQYLRPKILAKHFIVSTSEDLAPDFTEQPLSVRQNIIERFQQLSQLTGDEPEGYAFAHKIFSEFVHGVHRCVNLEQAFKKWEQSGSTSAEDYTAIHQLLIEHKKCPSENFRFRFEDEPGYLERSYRGLFFLFNRVSEASDKPLSMADLNQVAAIIGAPMSSKAVSYGIEVDICKHNPVFLEVLKKSTIINTSELSEELFIHYMKFLLEDNFVSSARSVYSKNVLQHIQSTGTHYALRLADFSTGIFVFKIMYKTRDKQRDCQQLLDAYYQTVASKTEPLDIIEAAVSVCCELQRRHPYSDGNGRTLFFILLPCLLYQQGLWLTSTLYDPWDLVDRITPRVIAGELLPLCRKRPINQHTLQWDEGVTTMERLRLYCAMGEMEPFKEMVAEDPDLLKQKFPPSDRTLLETAADHSQKDIVAYIFNHYPDSVHPIELTTLINYLNSHSYDTEMIRLLKAFSQQERPKKCDAN